MAFQLPRRLALHNDPARAPGSQSRRCAHCANTVLLRPDVRNSRCSACGNIICGQCATGETEDQRCTGHSSRGLGHALRLKRGSL